MLRSWLSDLDNCLIMPLHRRHVLAWSYHPLSFSFERDTSVTLWGNFFKSGWDVHLDDEVIGFWLVQGHCPSDISKTPGGNLITPWNWGDSSDLLLLLVTASQFGRFFAATSDVCNYGCNFVRCIRIGWYRRVVLLWAGFVFTWSCEAVNTNISHCRWALKFILLFPSLLHVYLTHVSVFISPFAHLSFLLCQTGAPTPRYIFPSLCLCSCECQGYLCVLSFCCSL